MWRGRASGLAGPRILAGAGLAFCLCVGAFLGATYARPQADAGWLLVGRSQGGEVLLSVPLPGERFALRYRNSLYGSLAEERFSVDAGGRLVLFQLAADEMALLGEYYEVAHAPRRAPPTDGRGWLAAPARQPVLDRLELLATRHGERTLVVDGRPPLPLWNLTRQESAAITLSAEKAR